MMRITEISRSQSVCRFRLEGWLTQLTSAELLAGVEPPLTAGASVLLDLAGVAFADIAAVETLRALRARGVVLAACSSFLSEMLRIDATGGGRAAGDAAAFAELVERNTARLYAVAQRLLRNEDEARDAVQDAFLSAFKGLAAFSGEAKLATWLHRIVVNAALMRLRSRKHRAEQSIDALLPRFDEVGGWAPEC